MPLLKEGSICIVVEVLKSMKFLKPGECMVVLLLLLVVVVSVYSS